MKKNILENKIIKYLDRHWIEEEFYGKKYLILKNGWVLSFKQQKEFHRLKPNINLLQPSYYLCMNGKSRRFIIKDLLIRYFGDDSKYDLFPSKQICPVLQTLEKNKWKPDFECLI